MLKKLIITITMTLFMIITVEAGFRWHDWKPRGLVWVVEDYNAPITDYATNQKTTVTIWTYRPYEVTTNNVGTRNMQDYSRDDYNILALGDSMVFGVYLANEDTITGWLNSFYEGTNIHVLNASKPGTSAPYHLEVLREKIDNIEIDEVMLFVFENDIRDMMSGVMRNVPVFEGWHHSAVAHAYGIRRVYAQHEQPTHQEAMDITYHNARPDLYEAHAQAVRDIHALLSERGIKLTLVVIPAWRQIAHDYPRTYQEHTRTLAYELNVPVIDAYPQMAEHDVAETYLLQRDGDTYTGNGHYSRYGSYIVAQAIYQQYLVIE